MSSLLFLGSLFATLILAKGVRPSGTSASGALGAAEQTSKNPLAFHAHFIAWVALGALCALYVFSWWYSYRCKARRREGDAHLEERERSTPLRLHRCLYAMGGIVLLGAAITWPLADLAKHWSLTALVAQRMLLALIVPVLLLLGLPREIVLRAIKPPTVDRVLHFVTRPIMAIIIFNGITIGTLLPTMLSPERHSGLFTTLIEIGLVLSGIIMWVPVLDILPGTAKLSRTVKAGYLVTQSLIPNIPATSFLLATHPLYHTYSVSPSSLGISALTDQRLAGITIKVTTVVLLWSIAGYLFFTGKRNIHAGIPTDTFTWEDVEWELRRIEALEHRRAVHRNWFTSHKNHNTKGNGNTTEDHHLPPP